MLLAPFAKMRLLHSTALNKQQQICLTNILLCKAQHAVKNSESWAGGPNNSKGGSAYLPENNRTSLYVVKLGYGGYWIVTLPAQQD